MVNLQKGVQQETAYSAVVVNDHNMYPYQCLYPCFYDPFWVKNYRDGDIRMIIHYMYNCTIYRQFLVALLFADLPSLSPSFHEMIFTLIFLSPGIHCVRMRISTDRARQGNGVFSCWLFVALYVGVFDWKDSVGQKAHRLSARSRFM